MRKRALYCLDELHGRVSGMARESSEFVRSCFEDSAEAFLGVCRGPVEDADLADLDECGFCLLRRARDIARLLALR